MNPSKVPIITLQAHHNLKTNCLEPPWTELIVCIRSCLPTTATSGLIGYYLVSATLKHPWCGRKSFKISSQTIFCNKQQRENRTKLDPGNEEFIKTTSLYTDGADSWISKRARWFDLKWGCKLGSLLCLYLNWYSRKHIYDGLFSF